jgi:hypothetical protein
MKMTRQTQFLEIAVEVPAGWLAIRYDFARKGDRYLDENDRAKLWHFPYTSSRRVVIVVKDEEF